MLSPAQHYFRRKHRRQRAAVAAGEQSLLTNGSFEKWLIHEPVDWAVTVAGASAVYREDDLSHVKTGFHAARLESDGTGDGAKVAQTRTIDTDEKTLTVRHHESNAAQLRVRVREAFGDERYLQAGGTWDVAEASRQLDHLDAPDAESIVFTPAVVGEFTIELFGNEADETYWIEFVSVE